MRKIIVVSFVTIDGVLQGPGGPTEDPTGGFKWGGWQAPHADEVSGGELMKILNSNYDLLLGRKTYEIFSAYWPYQDDEIGKKFDKVNKYVVGTSTIDLSWKNSKQISKDVVNEIKKLKQQDAPDLLVHGSSDLIQTLFANNLVDVLYVEINPLTLGKGKKLFKEGTPAKEWILTESVVSPKGVIVAIYKPGGEVRTGSFITGEPSAAELARRAKWAKEG